jgi:hypothetical protein
VFIHYVFNWTATITSPPQATAYSPPHLCPCPCLISPRSISSPPAIKSASNCSPNGARNGATTTYGNADEEDVDGDPAMMVMLQVMMWLTMPVVMVMMKVMVDGW